MRSSGSGKLLDFARAGNWGIEIGGIGRLGGRAC